MNNRELSNKRWLWVSALLMLTGCGITHRPSAVRPIMQHGYVDLSLLVHRHPGWRTVAQYDQALSRLQAAAKQTVVLSAINMRLRALPQIAIQSRTVSSVAPSQEEDRLQRLEQARVELLQRRLAEARQKKTAADYPLWVRDASAMFPDLSSAPNTELERLKAESVRLAVKVAYWKHEHNIRVGTALLTAPWMIAIDQQLRENTAALQQVSSRWHALALADQLQRQQAQTVSFAKRLTYIASQESETIAALEAQDSEVVRLEQARLSGERIALLHQEYLPQAPSVIKSDTLGTVGQKSDVLLRHVSVPVLEAAETRLLAQRKRWNEFLYDDTRAAALDAAQQQRWKITFVVRRPSEPNLTAAVGDILAKGVWKA